MNTEITYTYRDGGNYEQVELVVLSGFLTDEEKSAIWQTLELDHTFIPSQVGLKNLQRRMFAGLNEDDHVWHKLDSIEETRAEPNIGMKAKELLENFKQVKWDVLEAWDDLILHL